MDEASGGAGPPPKLQQLREMRSAMKQEQIEMQRKLLADPLTASPSSASPMKLDPLFNDMSAVNNSLRNAHTPDPLEAEPRRRNLMLDGEPRRGSGGGGLGLLAPLDPSPEPLLPEPAPRPQIGPTVPSRRHRALAPL